MYLQMYNVTGERDYLFFWGVSVELHMDHNTNSALLKSLVFYELYLLIPFLKGFSAI